MELANPAPRLHPQARSHNQTSFDFDPSTPLLGASIAKPTSDSGTSVSAARGNIAPFSGFETSRIAQRDFTIPQQIRIVDEIMPAKYCNV
uniref:Uncharacterized protein n=1 Tax=Bionectria ochroleuca TaxID=29856 RepID=A0A8H7KA99_BIOOC